MKLFIFMGPPGVGKGTHAKKLCDAFGFDQYSTGQVFRDEMAAGSDLGKKVKQYLDSGELVPDDIVIEVAANYLQQKKASGCNGVLLDGFPRTVPQAEALEATLATLDLPITGTVFLDADDDLLLGRLTGRRMCRDCGEIFHLEFFPPKQEGVCDKCGGEIYQRVDDSLDTVQNRLDVYKNQTAPLIDFYTSRDCISQVCVTNDTDTNQNRIRVAMGLA